MAAGRFSGKDFNFSVSGVAIEDELNSVDLNIDVDVPEVTAAADAAKVYVEGKYGWDYSVAGSADVAASQGDATIVGLLGGGAVASLFNPNGGAAGGATDDPEYSGNVFLRRYSLSTRVGEAASYTADFQGTAALTRDVTP